MSVAQILGLVLMGGVFVGLIAYREWEERATTSSPQKRRKEATSRP
ncbi:MAG TPA: hypothetical protein VGD07_17860 [Methylomirabilota bacterium]